MAAASQRPERKKLPAASARPPQNHSGPAKRWVRRQHVSLASVHGVRIPQKSCAGTGHIIARYAQQRAHTGGNDAGNIQSIRIKRSVQRNALQDKHEQRQRQPERIVRAAELFIAAAARVDVGRNFHQKAQAQPHGRAEKRSRACRPAVDLPVHVRIKRGCVRAAEAAAPASRQTTGRTRPRWPILFYCFVSSPSPFAKPATHASMSCKTLVSSS